MQNNAIILMTPAWLKSYSLKLKDYQRHDNLLGFDQECISKERPPKLYIHIAMDMHNYDNTPMQYTANFTAKTSIFS